MLGNPEPKSQELLHLLRDDVPDHMLTITGGSGRLRKDLPLRIFPDTYIPLAKCPIPVSNDTKEKIERGLRSDIRPLVSMVHRKEYAQTINTTNTGSLLEPGIEIRASLFVQGPRAWGDLCGFSIFPGCLVSVFPLLSAAALTVDSIGPDVDLRRSQPPVPTSPLPIAESSPAEWFKFSLVCRAFSPRCEVEFPCNPAPDPTKRKTGYSVKGEGSHEGISFVTGYCYMLDGCICTWELW